MRFIKAVLFVVVLLCVIGAAFIAAGTYNIGADEPHWEITARALDLLRDRSIETHARGVSVPNLDDPKRVAEGAEHYAAMCTACHLAPGMHESELRAGLYPQPPNLAQTPIDDPAEAFWIIKHGVKLTAMPAWGKTHDDDAIWGLVAFVRKLPQMTPEQYQQATASAGEHAHHHGEANGADEHSHEHSDSTDQSHQAEPTKDGGT
jgi:mono/diheme cytochrome c family protein